MRTSNLEIVDQKTKPKFPVFCCLGCLIPVVCVLLLMLMIVSIHYWRGTFRTRYPVGLETEHQITWKDSWQYIEKLVEDQKDEKEPLFVGTWQLEIPRKMLVGWQKIRLEIRPDYTFTLADLPEDLKNMDHFRGTVKGKWKVSYFRNTQAFLIGFLIESEYKNKGKGNLSIEHGYNLEPLMELWTLRQNEMSDEYLRLYPRFRDLDEYLLPTEPVWKKVVVDE